MFHTLSVDCCCRCGGAAAAAAVAGCWLLAAPAGTGAKILLAPGMPTKTSKNGDMTFWSAISGTLGNSWMRISGPKLVVQVSAQDRNMLNHLAHVKTNMCGR